MPKIKPLGENVLVEISPKEEKTQGGIYLPENSNGERPQEGKIVALGEKVKAPVKKGQKVIFAKYSGTEMKLEKKDYLILKSEDILAVVE